MMMIIIIIIIIMIIIIKGTATDLSGMFHVLRVCSSEKPMS